MDADAVYQVMDDIAEQRDVANEIAEALTTGISGANDDIDEDELLEELEQLELEDELESELGRADDVLPSLPFVPTAAVPKAKRTREEEEERELRELASFAS